MCSLVLLSSFNKNNYIRLKVDSNMSSVYGYYFFFIAFSRVRVFNFLNIYICMRCLHFNMIRLKVEYMRKKRNNIRFNSICLLAWKWSRLHHFISCSLLCTKIVCEKNYVNMCLWDHYRKMWAQKVLCKIHKEIKMGVIWVVKQR